MKKMTTVVKSISSILDKLAGICIFSVMLLIVANIILREAFSRPILGTYELAGYLTAIGVGLALAHCAFNNGHIAVTFIMEKLPKKIQNLVDLFVHFVSLLFWSVAVWYLIKFAQVMQTKGLVSPTAEIPVYPFIYLTAIGVFGLSFVMFFKLVNSLQGVLENGILMQRLPESKALRAARKVAR